MVEKRSQLYLIINFIWFSIIAFLFYTYHEKFYFGDAVNYLNADSKYYLELSQQMSSFSDMIIMFLANKNLFGQLVYYNLILQGSRILFYIFNIIVLFYLLLELQKNLENQQYKNHILFLLLLNPAIITSLSGPNKEITGFISILFIINYILKRKSRYILFSFIFAFFTRFELIAVIIVFLFFRRFAKHTQYILLISFALLISLTIYFTQNYNEQLFNVFEIRENSLGFVFKMAELNQMGLYFITFLPKLCLNLFGDILALNFFLLKGYSLFIYISQLLYIYLIFIIVKGGRVNIQNSFFLFFLIYCLVFTVPSFIQHRYFLPIYPILIFLAYYKKYDLHERRSKMIILINTSNLYVGGGVQVALSFINELKYLKLNNKYHILTSKVIDEQLDKHTFSDEFKFYYINQSPSLLKTRLKIVYYLEKLEEKIMPDMVFSIFGPSYWRPKAKHLMGFADGWVYNPDSIAYERLSFFKKYKLKLLSVYKKYYLKRDADYFVLETEDAKQKFSKFVNVPSEKIFVVGNTYSTVFNNNVLLDKHNSRYIQLPEKSVNEFRLLYITHNHPNKNLSIINKVIPLLKDYNIKFVLTIDSNSCSILFGNNKNIINVGPVPLESCPSLYSQCDALFAPTLLETFSASYPESMKMKIPILTSNYSFAIDICGNAAYYFNPIDENDIASKIVEFVTNESLRRKLIEFGNEQLNQFETAKSRAEKYLALCEFVYNINLKDNNVQK